MGTVKVLLITLTFAGPSVLQPNTHKGNLSIFSFGNLLFFTTKGTDIYSEECSLKLHKTMCTEYLTHLKYSINNSANSKQKHQNVTQALDTDLFNVGWTLTRNQFL